MPRSRWQEFYSGGYVTNKKGQMVSVEVRFHTKRFKWIIWVDGIPSNAEFATMKEAKEVAIAEVDRLAVIGNV